MLALIALFILGVILLGLGYLFRDVIDPPAGSNQLTPMPSDAACSYQRPEFKMPDFAARTGTVTLQRPMRPTGFL